MSSRQAVKLPKSAANAISSSTTAQSAGSKRTVTIVSAMFSAPSKRARHTRISQRLARVISRDWVYRARQSSCAAIAASRSALDECARVRARRALDDRGWYIDPCSLCLADSQQILTWTQLGSHGSIDCGVERFRAKARSGFLW